MTKLQQRIVEELQRFPDCRAYYGHLILKVWPPDKYPRAYRRSCNGGPPGVAMAFGRALREMDKANILYRPNERRERYGQPDIQLLYPWRIQAAQKGAKDGRL
jgi:hypothetical protein